MPGQATAGQLQAAALSVRVIYQSASTAPCCVHMVFPLTRSAEQCYDAFRKVNSSAKECERTPNSLYHNKHRIILHRFPLSNNLLYLRQKNEKERSAYVRIKNQDAYHLLNESHQKPKPKPRRQHITHKKNRPTATATSYQDTMVEWMHYIAAMVRRVTMQGVVYTVSDATRSYPYHC